MLSLGLVHVPYRVTYYGQIPVVTPTAHPKQLNGRCWRMGLIDSRVILSWLMMVDINHAMVNERWMMI